LCRGAGWRGSDGRNEGGGQGQGWNQGSGGCAGGDGSRSPDEVPLTTGKQQETNAKRSQQNDL
jgi:hypothetical protein